MKNNKQILAMDIGGTNARFGLFSFSGEKLLKIDEKWVSTKDLKNTLDLINACEKAFANVFSNISVISIGFAGDVCGQIAKLTNGNLEIDSSEFERFFPNIKCLLLNDFCATAFAFIDHNLWNIEVDTIFSSQSDIGSTRAIIGAGTGLGAALLCRDNDKWISLPSEIGHSPFPFVGSKEIKFCDFLIKNLSVDYIRCENVLSGRGLLLLHKFLYDEDLSIEEISKKYLRNNSIILEMYSKFYARICKIWALSTLCRGGLWICGGIAAKNPLVIKSLKFREEFFLEAPAHINKFLQSIPVFLVNDTNSGLIGSAIAAKQLLFLN